MIEMVGFFKVFLLAIFDSNDNNSEGNNNKLETIANNRVTETNPPSALVPPKLDIVKTRNPKNKTMEV